jgi:hypothetical protein
VFADPRKRLDYFLLYSEDVVLHGYQEVKPGLESVKQFYNAFWEVFPDGVNAELEDTHGLLSSCRQRRGVFSFEFSSKLRGSVPNLRLRGCATRFLFE